MNHDPKCPLTSFLRSSVAATFAVAFLATGAPAQSAPAHPASWRAPSDSALHVLAFDRVRHELAIGLVVGVSESGRTRAVAVGLGTRGGPPLARDAVFEIGSTTKLLTTTLLAEMVERGEVRLDDPVRLHLPAQVLVPSRSGREITLLDLATSTSGLPPVPDVEPADPANPYASFGAADLYAYLSRVTLLRDPGARYEYSNLGMGLLGHALAFRAGRSYEALVTERILQPLGMRETWIRIPPHALGRLAQGHTVDLEPAPAWDFDALAGAGAFRSTVDDMARFVAAVIEPPDGALGRALRLATKPQRPTDLPNMSVALGWHVITRGERTIVWHNGETAGAHAFIGFDPTTGANAILLSNTAVDNDDLGFHLIDASVRLRAMPVVRSVVELDSLRLERFVGRYEISPGVEIAVMRRGAALSAQVTGQLPFRIFPVSDRRFFFRVVEAELEFETDELGRATGLVLHQGGMAMQGRRQP